MNAQHRYRVFDSILTADIALPELGPAETALGSTDPQDLCSLSVGAVPDHLPEATTRTALHQAYADQDHLLTLPGFGRLRISAGTRITFDPDPAANDAACSVAHWRTVVLSSGLTSLAYQRGLVPIHASSVVLPGEDGATLLLGHATAGKSTLAAALVQTGAHLLADDLTALRIDAQGCVALPGTRLIKLHEDSVRALGADPALLEPVRPKLTKYFFAPGTFCSTPVPVLRCVILRHARSGQPEGFETRNGVSAFASVSNHIHRRRAGAAMGLRGALFQKLAILTRTVPIQSYCFDQDFEALGALAEGLREAV
ncbi:MAG: hypothetical protein ACPGOY_12345 [Rhodospirillaceae bacterium]